MGGNRLCFDQGDIGHEQAQNPFAFADINAGIGPYLRKLLCKFGDLATHFCVDRVGFLMTSPPVIFDDILVQS